MTATCKHKVVDIAISFPREITAQIDDSQIFKAPQVTEIKAANSQDVFGVGPGRLKIHCRQCGRDDYWTGNHPELWPKWARARFMNLARQCPELMTLVHGMQQSQLLMEYD